PLTNPANPTMEIMGVFDESLLESMAHVLSNLGVKKGMVVYGMEKLDEISICGPTKVCMFRDNTFECRTIVPEDVGLKSYGKEELKGGTPEEN
ncbi:MAG TPA: anthranilate phosphoribosyltransferase, partial [Lachnospiraceae bacterium]|nr:anthranilate phosphoribosyltransferase [Lachnospiraceae bacterium]